jgi:hypothetical protein
MANQNMTHVATIKGTPPGIAPSASGGAKPVVQVDTMAATAPSTGDTIVLALIPVDAKLTSVMLAFDDLGTSAPADLGFYRDDDGTTAVDSDAIATAIAMGTAQTTWAEYRFEAANINTANQPAWELAGLSARPSYGMFALCATFGTISSGAGGDVSVKLEMIQ